ncbi:uncharacterized protein LOC127757867 isoform X2 [Oryza glaberrima]|uniref:uncharacterized protein LOC127757867 isoform X2 n=1 Tax=Oryza glaberrima TaxID=4538 RepID=UPI00224BEA72|nr:uncharacterized protein LOC127757867 isoform X2 [Oryza glaberrima]
MKLEMIHVKLFTVAVLLSFSHGEGRPVCRTATTPPCFSNTTADGAIVSTLQLKDEARCNSVDLAHVISKNCDPSEDSPSGECCRPVMATVEQGPDTCICNVANESVLATHGFSAEIIGQLYDQCGGARDIQNLSSSCYAPTADPSGTGALSPPSPSPPPPPPASPVPSPPPALVIVRYSSGNISLEITVTSIAGATFVLLVVALGYAYTQGKKSEAMQQVKAKEEEEEAAAAALAEAKRKEAKEEEEAAAAALVEAKRKEAKVEEASARKKEAADEEIEEDPVEKNRGTQATSLELVRVDF